MRNYKIHLDGLDRVDGVFEDWSFPRAFNLAADPKERFNIIWQNTWIGERIGPFVAAYQASVKKYPNLAAGQPNNQPPRYGKEGPAAETGAEGVLHKLESIRQEQEATTRPALRPNRGRGLGRDPRRLLPS